MNGVLPCFKVICENGYTQIAEMSLGTSIEKAREHFIGCIINTAQLPRKCETKIIDVKEISYIIDTELREN